MTEKEKIERIKKQPDTETELSADERLGVKPREIQSVETVKPVTMTERIAAFLPKGVGEKIIVKHAYGDWYRVNWYQPVMDGETVVKNWKICSSRFMEIVEHGKSLNIRDVTRTDEKKSKVK